MLLVSQVIQTGIDDYKTLHRRVFFSMEPCYTEGFHGAKSIGMVHTGIDWQQIYMIGLKLGEMLDAQTK